MTNARSHDIIFKTDVRIVCSYHLFANIQELSVLKKHCLSRYFILIAIPVLIVFGCFIIHKNSEAESIGNKIDDVASYESVLICKGDTLWSIAEANLEQPTKAEIQAYVEEIAKINSISSTNIHAGNYILIPKYKNF